jgi:hypothetical protein
MGITHTNWYNKLVRRIYKSLPLSWNVKQRLKEIYLRRPGAWEAGNKDRFRQGGNGEALDQTAASARQFDPAQPWVLVIDSGTPTPDENSGHARMAALLRLLQKMSFHAAFVWDSDAYLPQGQQVLEQQGIAVVYGFDAARRHLAEVGGKYHFVLMFRPEVAFKYLPYIRAYALYSEVIYDTTGLRWVRSEREAPVPDDSGNYGLTDILSQQRIERFNATCADLVLAATDEEKDRLLHEEPDIEVAVLPHIHEIFSREDLLRNKGQMRTANRWPNPTKLG